jgi:hypothetical protein
MIKIYGPYVCKDGRKRMATKDTETGKKSSISYARYLLEQYLGRKLESWEQADHIDNDPTNDVIENLQILTSKENNIKAVKHFGKEAKWYYFICPECNKLCRVLESQYRANNIKQGKFGPFCGKSCSGKWSRRIQISAGINVNEIKHGTESTYKYRKCRCDLCREAHTLNARVQRERKRNM